MILRALNIYLFLITFSLCACSQQTCPEDSKSYQNYLGSKTPYRVVGNNTFGKIEYPGCTPSKIWMILRHGTRNPSKNFIKSMETRLPEIRDNILKHNSKSSEVLHNSDLIALQQWENKLKASDEKKLAREGKNEMVNIAERMQSRFPSLLSNIYSNTSYKFKFTHSQRTRKSAFYFATGLFGKKTANSVSYPEPSKKDPILRFYKLCKKWGKEVNKNPESLTQRREFQDSPLMVKTVQEITKKLKLPPQSLSFEDVYTMYSACAFETAWKMDSKSPWCSPFSINDLKVLEYYEDLKYYWIDGYGFDLNHKQACVVFNDIVSFFNSKSIHPKATVYFTHSGTLLKVLSHLELFKEDKPLTRHNFNDKVDKRNFRVSHVAPFATNLAMVLFDCDGVQKILTLHQEHIVRLPSCPTQDLCNYRDVLKYYKNSTDNCDFDEICENTDEDDESESSNDDDN